MLSIGIATAQRRGQSHLDLLLLAARAREEQSKRLTDFAAG
jgi:hypothetical protein